MAVIVCILIDYAICLLPRGRFERWSWQIHVAAVVLQSIQFQHLNVNVAQISPAKTVEILRSPSLVSGNSALFHATLVYV